MESRFDEKYVSTVKSTTKVTECLAKTFENRSIAKDHRVQKYEIFELKYENRNIIRKG